MLDRKSAPSHAEINSFNLPSPEIHVLDSGIRMLALRNVAQQVIKIELIFQAGKWFEVKKGVAYFTAHLLEKGTATRSSFEIADFLDRYGASIETSAGFDYASVSLFSLTKNIIHVLPVFLELVTASIFPDAELAIQKDIFNQNLKINNEKTSSVASKLIRQHLFGTSHPYGASIESDEVNQLQQHDLSNFFQDHYSLSEVFVVGAVDDKLLNVLMKGLSTIPTGLNKKNSPSFTSIENESSEYVEKVSSVQSSIRLGKRTINRNHVDYPALILLNHIFGGYFGSRLMKNIREEKGLTYGIYSSVNNLKKDAFFVIAADVNRTNKDLAINEIKNELNLLCNESIGLDELHTAKSHLLGSLQLEIANPFSVIEKIKTIQLYELNKSYYNDLFVNILSLNQITLQEVANKHLSDKMIEVAVG